MCFVIKKYAFFGGLILEFLWFSLAGVISGIFAGMGMGGGTFLIPILTLVLSVSQTHAQLINLIVFSLSSIVVLIIQAKNKLLDFEGFWWIVIPALLVSLVGSIFALSLHSDVLKYSFAGFVCLVGILQIVFLILAKRKKKES